MSRIIGSHGTLPFFVLLLICAFLIPAGAGFAQSSKEEMMTLDQYKAFLKDEGKQRGLSEAKAEELEKLLPGGGLTERVVKIGISTFILNLAMIYTVAIVSMSVIVLFFTPFGLFLFRGNLHAFVGSILKATGLSKNISDNPNNLGFGDHLITWPKKCLQESHGRVRKAFAMYMHNNFIPQYKNNIPAVAFIGTAFLILNIGLRGVKFMVAHQPDLIIIAILVEITVLCLLGLTTWYEKEEDETEGDGTRVPGTELTWSEVKAKLDALEHDLEESAHKSRGMVGR